MFEFIKAVSETVLDMITAAYYVKLLIFILATFWEKLVCHRQTNIYHFDYQNKSWYRFGVKWKHDLIVRSKQRLNDLSW